jgi:hypothetical protein
MTLLTQIVNELPADWQPFTRGVALHEQGATLTLDDGVCINIVTVIDHKLWARCKAPPIEVTLHVSGRQPTVGDAHTIPELVQKMAKMITDEIACGRLNPMKVPLCIVGDVRVEVKRRRDQLDSVAWTLQNMGGQSHSMDRMMRLNAELNGDK